MFLVLSKHQTTCHFFRLLQCIEEETPKSKKFVFNGEQAQIFTLAFTVGILFRATCFVLLNWIRNCLCFLQLIQTQKKKKKKIALLVLSAGFPREIISQFKDPQFESSQKSSSMPSLFLICIAFNKLKRGMLLKAYLLFLQNA